MRLMLRRATYWTSGSVPSRVTRGGAIFLHHARTCKRKDMRVHSCIMDGCTTSSLALHTLMYQDLPVARTSSKEVWRLHITQGTPHKVIESWMCLPVHLISPCCFAICLIAGTS
jgi:hypothetical protein